MALATATFHAAVVTPEAQVFNAEANAAQFPAYDGLVGILAHHAPLLTKLGAGLLRLETTQGEKRFFISGGFAEVKDNVLSVLTDEAIPAEQITPERAASELGKAQALAANDAAASTRREKALARARAMQTLSAA